MQSCGCPNRPHLGKITFRTSGAKRMCIFCEEPFRSVLIGLAALGAVCLVRMVQKGVERLRSPARAVTDKAS
jgi:hypothetical protein